MTQQQQPVTPPSELRARWRREAQLYRDGAVDREDWLIDSAAQWGLSQCRRFPVPTHFLGVPLIPPADCIDSQSWIAMRIYEMGCDQRDKDIERERQEAADLELEKCRQWLGINGAPAELIDGLLDARRPKPKSEKQQALEQLDGIRAVFRMSHGGEIVCDSILRALKSIPDPS